MDNPTSSNPNITPEMIEAGRFKITDVPGMMPSQETIRAQAEQMAREMFPHKFKVEKIDRIPLEEYPIGEPSPLLVQGQDGLYMISPADFDKANEEARRLAITPPEIVARMEQDAWMLADQKAIAVADAGECVPVVNSPAMISPISRLFAAVRTVLNHPAANLGHPDFTELRIAYQALGLKDE